MDAEKLKQITKKSKDVKVRKIKYTLKFEGYDMEILYSFN
jgi:hypothetical protein